MLFLNKDKWTYNEQTSFYIGENNAKKTAFSDEQQNGLLDLEADSWWFSYRAQVIIDKMDRFFDKLKITLDVGGGNGYTSGKAQKSGYKMGLIEPSFTACKNAKHRKIDTVCCGTVTDDSIYDSSIDQMLLLDVLEHIEDDRAFLKLLKNKLTDNGFLLITVPAFMCLWSSEDVSAGHYRRYRLKELCSLIKKIGFRIRYKSYFMSFLFIPILVIRVLFEKIGIIKSQEACTAEEQKKIAISQFKKRKGIVNLVLEMFENLEKSLMKNNNAIPFGTSIIVVAQKRKG